MPLFYPPAPTPQFVGTEPVGVAGALTILLTANQVYLYLFEVPPTGMTILGTKWRMGATTNGHTSMGIYTYAGNLVSGSDTRPQLNVAHNSQSFRYGTAVYLTGQSLRYNVRLPDHNRHYHGHTG